MMFFGVLWCSMVFYDVLCLKSILGFLLSERSSRVSPLIFYISIRGQFHIIADKEVCTVSL